MKVNKKTRDTNKETTVFGIHLVHLVCVFITKVDTGLNNTLLDQVKKVGFRLENGALSDRFPCVYRLIPFSREQTASTDY